MDVLLDSIIIGAGPAGLTAALYTARARLKIKIFEQAVPGGQITLTNQLDNYPGFPQGIAPSQLIDNITRQINMLGVDIDLKKIESIEVKDGKQKIFKVSGDDFDYLSKSLIIATGATPAKLNIPGEDKFIGKGVSYCATCDAPMFKNKTVVVIGGGNSAVEEAIFLSGFVNKLFLVHRRSSLRATAILQERLIKLGKCELVLDSLPLEVIGKDKVSGLVIQDCKSQREKTIDCDGVFVFIGSIANTQLVKSIIELDDKNFIIVDNQMRTSEPGVFACGDCIKKDLKQVITACADGAQAAYSAQNLLIKY